VPDEFAHLYGRSLVSFAREAAGELKWDRIYVKADGSISLERMVEAIINGGSKVDPELRRPPVLVVVFAALRANRLGLVADGDETLGHAVDLMVPPGLLRGSYVVCADTEAGAWLRAEDPNGREVGAHYFRPCFAAAVQPAAAGKTGAAGRPSSWYLVETEYRRRYNAGERHADGAIESPKAWADVLLAWLRENHPGSPPLSPKTARNNLSKMLRRLKRGQPEIGT
jgi:hypothetical protein